MQAGLHEEAQIRSEDFGSDAFFRRRNVLFVSIFLFAALSSMVLLISPPKNIGLELEKKSDGLLLFRDGKLIFDQAQNPPAAGHDSLAISLPFRNAHTQPGYIKDGIWYEFPVKIPAAAFKEGSTGVLLPMVWGQGKVFLNGQLHDFGVNHVPILALPKRDNVIHVRANIEGTNRTNPISATFPLVVGDVNSIRALKAKIDSGYEINYRALAVYSLAILLFGMLFIAFPRKPELFAFLVFLFCSLIYSALVTVNETNAFPVMAIALQQAVLVFFDYATNFSALLFSLYFLRAHPKSVQSAAKNVLLYTVILCPPTALFLYRALNAPHLIQVGHLVTNFSFLLSQAAYVWPRYYFSMRERSIPVFRKTACTIVVGTILAFYLVNIIDYFVIFTGITSLQSNGLILNIALAITVAFEVSRAEKNQKILGSMLPREVRETLHLAERKANQRGFVVLVDAIGYSANRNRFDDASERNAYIERLAKKMLKPLNEFAFKDFSILNCTGDGIYCAIRGEANESTLRSAIRFAVAVTEVLPDEQDIQFRAAIGYGTYSVSIIEAGQVRKEFVAGNVLNDLSRVIGNSKGRHQVRILASKAISHLVDDQGADAVIDKHGFEHRFVELEKVKRAA